MELRQLTALVTVAETGSVTSAARILHLVQPAVTRQIRLLENEVGVPLFERTRQGMTLTEAGTLLTERARRVLLELEHARAEIQPDPAELSGVVTVGMPESVVDQMALPLMTAVSEAHPGVRLRIITGYSGHLRRWLDAGDVDLSMLYNLTGTSSLSVVPLVQERLVAVAPAEVGLTAGRPVSWEALLGQRLVLPVTGHGLRALIDEGAAAVGAVPDVSIEVNALHLQKGLVAAGHGWTVLPAGCVAGDVARGTLSATPLFGPEVDRDLVLGLRRGGPVRGAVDAVAQRLVRLVRSLVRTRAWPMATMSRDPAGPDQGITAKAAPRLTSPA